MSALSRHAAPLRVEVHPQPALQLAVSFLALLSAVSVLAAPSAQGWISPLQAACLLPLLAVLAWRQAKVRHRLLMWDGQVWRLHDCTPAGGLRDAGFEVQLSAVFDFDRALLLRARRCDPAAPAWRRGWLWACPVYLPLSAARQGGAWGALRAILFSARQAPRGGADSGT